MTDKEFNDFLRSIPTQTSYLDSGFDLYMNKNLFDDEQFQSGADFNSLVESVSFDRISQGTASSAGDRITINFDKGQILISDGGTNRIVIGEIE